MISAWSMPAYAACQRSCYHLSENGSTFHFFTLNSHIHNTCSVANLNDMAMNATASFVFCFIANCKGFDNYAMKERYFGVIAIPNILLNFYY